MTLSDLKGHFDTQKVLENTYLEICCVCRPLNDFKWSEVMSEICMLFEFTYADKAQTNDIL